jgi:hypothetical protein
MSEPTEADRQKAADILRQAERASRTAYYDDNVWDGEADTLIDAIAQALADMRAYAARAQANALFEIAAALLATAAKPDFPAELRPGMQAAGEIVARVASGEGQQ